MAGVYFDFHGLCQLSSFVGGLEGEGWLGYHGTRATRTEDQGVGGLTSSCYITGELFSFTITFDHQFCLQFVRVSHDTFH